jgi:3-deoxy-D-manno-octulosonic-acid transferase
MILFFYNLALLAVLVVGAPWWLWKMATTKKYREGLLDRLGWGRRAWGAEFKKDRPLIWVHAVSVGEVLAVSRLIKTLDAALPDYFIAVSTTTRTGQALARERFGANRVFYCPLDLPWAVRAYLTALDPCLFILAETEFWPNLLSSCFRRGIPVAVVNARISDRSWPRYKLVRAFFEPLLSRLSVVLAQSETDAERLKALGCLPGRVSVAGNLKFDVRAAWEAEATTQLKALAPGLSFVVAGSTLEGEEAALVEAWPHLLEENSKLAMVLAPRHPERFAGVVSLLEKSGIHWVKRSDWRAVTSRMRKPVRAGEIVLLDTIGELASVYSLASVAFVGGSLVPAGGHNPLEPAQFGVPIVMGPHYANFRAITDDLLAHEAVLIADSTNFARALMVLLRDRRAAEEMGERAKLVFNQQAGATGRCVEALRTLLPRSSPFFAIPEPSEAMPGREVECGKQEEAGTKNLPGPRISFQDELLGALERAAKSPDASIGISESGAVVRATDDQEEK